ncbi:MAG TPA: HD domain-containing phosphohydrolase [Acidimicrobiales bacterium]|jgi:hypothetical protein|nr:HD domain-containing phosphohydrolase [Acidimicrobiales bacterium]
MFDRTTPGRERRTRRRGTRGRDYTALLINVGCHSDAHEQAKWFGDDIALKATKYEYEQRSLKGAAAVLRRIGAGNPPLHRFRIGLEFALSGHREVDNMIAQHARLAKTLAEHLGLPQAVLDALSGSYERWDGRGWPGVLAGEDVPLASRIAQLAEFVEVAHRVGGIDAAVAIGERRAGTQFDPALVAALRDGSQAILGDLDTIGTWDAVIQEEPSLTVMLSGAEFDAALAAIASFVDLKSPYTLGHSRAVAELASAAGSMLGLPDDEVRTLYRAGLVHDFGRLGVSNSIWDKAGPLGSGEWERVRMHPYITERMLQQSDAARRRARPIRTRSRASFAAPRRCGPITTTHRARAIGGPTSRPHSLAPLGHRAGRSTIFAP